MVLEDAPHVVVLESFAVIAIVQENAVAATMENVVRVGAAERRSVPIVVVLVIVGIVKVLERLVVQSVHHVEVVVYAKDARENEPKIAAHVLGMEIAVAVVEMGNAIHAMETPRVEYVAAIVSAGIVVVLVLALYVLASPNAVPVEATAIAQSARIVTASVLNVVVRAMFGPTSFFPTTP